VCLEQYFDYIFPDEQDNQPHLKLLAMAKKWKQQKAEREAQDDDEQ
jgi:crooked neck